MADVGPHLFLTHIDTDLVRPWRRSLMAEILVALILPVALGALLGWAVFKYTSEKP
jgi:hypothetical protein